MLLVAIIYVQARFNLALPVFTSSIPFCKAVVAVVEGILRVPHAVCWVDPGDYFLVLNVSVARVRQRDGCACNAA